MLRLIVLKVFRCVWVLLERKKLWVCEGLWKMMCLSLSCGRCVSSLIFLRRLGK